MEATIQTVQESSRRFGMPSDPLNLRIAIFAPPLVEPFQPSLSLPYLAAQLRSNGLSPVCHNLSSLFYLWLFRRIRMESMERYRLLSDAIAVLRDPRRFFDAQLYHDSLEALEQFVLSIAE